MQFVGIKELSQNTSRLINKKDWIVITKNGKPRKVMIDIDEDDLEDLILAKHYQLEKDLKKAAQDAQSGKLKTLDQVMAQSRRKRT